uniref:Acetyl-CoA hydrolase n=1 Tax=Panagrolaimus sp. JU765 TaxID=591449 RepID=A0AC34QQS0_9BILA
MRRVAIQKACFQVRFYSGIRPGVQCRTLTNPIYGKEPKYVSADEAVSSIKSNEHIHIHGAPSTPSDLMAALGRHILNKDLTGLKASHIILTGEIPWTDKKFYSRIRSNCLFICAGMRKLVNSGAADYTPVFLQDIIKLYDDKIIPVDVSLVTVSPPDEHGYCSLGLNVDCTSAAVRNSKRIIAAVNPNMPKTFGDSTIHISQFDAVCKSDVPVMELPKVQPSPEETAISKHIAENLVDDYATLQMGIGSIPDCVLSLLTNHKELGVHTELVSSGVIDLIEKNVLTNSRKAIDQGKIVTSFAMGTRKFYDLIDNNQLFVFASSAYTNNFHTIVAQSNMTAINSAIEIDLAGQVVSDTIGKNFYSGFGGQVDFINAASQALDGKGKAILALPSRTAKKQPKIVPFIQEGAGVVTTRAHVHYVVTEQGIANLFGKSVRQRAYELIKIAHPDDREKLEKAAFARFKCMPTRD